MLLLFYYVVPILCTLMVMLFTTSSVTTTKGFQSFLGLLDINNFTCSAEWWGLIYIVGNHRAIVLYLISKDYLGCQVTMHSYKITRFISNIFFGKFWVCQGYKVKSMIQHQERKTTSQTQKQWFWVYDIPKIWLVSLHLDQKFSCFLSKKRYFDKKIFCW